MSRRKDLFIQLSRIIACLGVCGVHIGYGYEVKGIGGGTICRKICSFCFLCVERISCLYVEWRRQAYLY